jgi:hypothetical protein
VTLLIAEITYLFSVRLALFRWQELYLGLFTELGNLLMDERLVKATEKDSPQVKGKYTIETIER